MHYGLRVTWQRRDLRGEYYEDTVQAEGAERGNKIIGECHGECYVICMPGRSKAASEGAKIFHRAISAPSDSLYACRCGIDKGRESREET